MCTLRSMSQTVRKIGAKRLQRRVTRLPIIEQPNIHQQFALSLTVDHDHLHTNSRPPSHCSPQYSNMGRLAEMQRKLLEVRGPRIPSRMSLTSH